MIIDHMLGTLQYFPERINDEVVVVGPVGAGGLELANSPFKTGVGAGAAVQNAFDNFESTLPPYTAAIPWGVPGALQSFL